MRQLSIKIYSMGDFDQLNTTVSDDSEPDDEVNENVNIVMVTLFAYKT